MDRTRLLAAAVLPAQGPQRPKLGRQALDLSPAQGAVVEFTMAEDGLYPIVTHAFNFVARGALGLFRAGDGDPRT